MRVDIKNVSKKYGGKYAVKEVSLALQGSEIVCLLGPSGAGKTTLIRMITGAVRCDGGEIWIDDIRVPSMKLYREIGFMPQNDALYTDLSGLDNLLFFAGLYRMKKPRDRAMELLKLMDLSEDRDKMVGDYSGGMKKRLSLAVALLHEPKLLVLDEPTVGIDPVLRRTIWEKFHALRDAGVSMIVSTHVMDEAVKCDRTALLYNGRLIYDDTTSNLLAKTKQGNMEELFFMAKEAQS